MTGGGRQDCQASGDGCCKQTKSLHELPPGDDITNRTIPGDDRPIVTAVQTCAQPSLGLYDELLSIVAAHLRNVVNVQAALPTEADAVVAFHGRPGGAARGGDLDGIEQ